MSVRIRRTTKIGNGKYISESYKPSEYLFILVLKSILKFFLFIFFSLPFYILKLQFFMIRTILKIILKKKENAQKFLHTINSRNLKINQLNNFKIF